MNTVDTLIQKLHSKEIDAAVLFSKPVLSFAPGDVVLKDGDEHIIVDSEALRGGVRYSTNISDIVHHDQLTLIRKATEATLKYADIDYDVPIRKD
jgi:hypothetical protein